MGKVDRVCFWVSFFTIVAAQFQALVGCETIGVNYGMLGNNLPTAERVIQLCKSKNITKVRIFDPNSAALRALENSGIEAIVGVRNEDLERLSVDPSYAMSWVSINVMPHAPLVKYRYISVGNEVIPGKLSAFVLPAMKNLAIALNAFHLTIPVTTAIATLVLGDSYPPSHAAFSNESRTVMAAIAVYLSATKAPLLVNVYPYFAYSGDPKDVRLDYALLNTTEVVVHDGNLGYTNMFDAMVDGIYSALEKVEAENVTVVVSETGWPSAGDGGAASKINSKTYVNNLISHVSTSRGTPRRPGKSLETYLFAIFNENQKPEGVEQNFGLYHPDLTAVYPVNFTV